MTLLAYAVAGWLLLVGIWGIATSRNLLHQILCFSVLHSSSYVLLVAVGYRRDAAPPVFVDAPPGTPVVDPVVQALTMTDSVVGTTVLVLLLALAIQAHKRTGTLDPDELTAVEG